MLLQETVSPSKALKIAIHMEGEAQNQQKTNQNLDTNAQSMNRVNNFQGRSRTTSYQQQRKNFTRYPIVPHNSQNTITCANCGQL